MTIIDYGGGNLLNVIRAFRACGADVTVAERPEVAARAGRLVFPGVGAFADAMQELKRRDMVSAIKSFASAGNPFLGICLGMQMMLDESDEFGLTRGLSLIPGRVVPVPATGHDGRPHKIPHIGWNELYKRSESDWAGTLLDGIDEGVSAYFVHSYMAAPADPAQSIAHCYYGAHPVCAVVGAGVTFGCQFHPEKSGPVGLRMISNFLSL